MTKSPWQFIQLPSNSRWHRMSKEEKEDDDDGDGDADEEEGEKRKKSVWRQRSNFSSLPMDGLNLYEQICHHFKGNRDEARSEERK